MRTGNDRCHVVLEALAVEAGLQPSRQAALSLAAASGPGAPAATAAAAAFPAGGLLPFGTSFTENLEDFEWCGRRLPTRRENVHERERERANITAQVGISEISTGPRKKSESEVIYFC